MKHQGWIWLAMMPLAAFWPQFESARFVLDQKPAGYRLHLTGLLIHQVIVATALIALVGLWPALFVGLMSHSLFGIYMVLVFVTNHTAMPLSDGPVPRRFFETQLRTTRNVATHPVADIAFGGLNFQVEHHLFPSMPRPKLRAAGLLVRPFLEDAGLEYKVASLTCAYGDVLRHMRAVGHLAHISAENSHRGPGLTERQGQVPATAQHER